MANWIRVAILSFLGVALWAQASGSYLGIWIWEVDAARAKELRLTQAGGVEVTLVRPGSPADQAGVKAGDVVAEYDGQKVQGIEQFSRLVRDTPSGRAVRLRVMRNGAAQLLTAKIAAQTERAAESARIVITQERQQDRQDVPSSLMTWRSPVLGVDAEPLFGQLAEYFGVGEAVLVRGVASGSPAERAGLRAGDVITRVGKQAVTTPAEITARLRSVTTPGVQVVIMRDRKEATFNVILEERR
jgi:serine protease Do